MKRINKTIAIQEKTGIAVQIVEGSTIILSEEILTKYLEDEHIKSFMEKNGIAKLPFYGFVNRLSSYDGIAFVHITVGNGKDVCIPVHFCLALNNSRLTQVDSAVLELGNCQVTYNVGDDIKLNTQNITDAFHKFDLYIDFFNLKGIDLRFLPGKIHKIYVDDDNFIFLFILDTLGRVIEYIPASFCKPCLAEETAWVSDFLLKRGYSPLFWLTFI